MNPERIEKKTGKEWNDEYEKISDSSCRRLGSLRNRKHVCRRTPQRRGSQQRNPSCRRHCPSGEKCGDAHGGGPAAVARSGGSAAVAVHGGGSAAVAGCGDPGSVADLLLQSAPAPTPRTASSQTGKMVRRSGKGFGKTLAILPELW